MRKIVVGVLAAVGSLTMASVAFAGSSSTLLMQYGGVGGETQHRVAAGVVGVGGVHTSGSLPFTGLDLALIAVAALALMATGWMLRRVAQQKQR